MRLGPYCIISVTDALSIPTSSFVHSIVNIIPTGDTGANNVKKQSSGIVKKGERKEPLSGKSRALLQEIQSSNYEYLMLGP